MRSIRGRGVGRVVALVAASVFVLASCGSDSDSADDAETATANATPTATATTSPTAAPTEPPTTSPTPESTEEATAQPTPTESLTPEPTPTEAPAGLIEVEYANGEVVGGVGRANVPTGEQVELRVTADVSDEVHVHGYDVFGPVAPGAPAVLVFEANIPGVWEVELEGLGHLLVELEVS